MELVMEKLPTPSASFPTCAGVCGRNSWRSWANILEIPWTHPMVINVMEELGDCQH